MTEQAQYISGRTVQEQMDNLIKYVDDRSKTVAEEEAQRVLVPAENAKVAAEAAADRAVGSVAQFESRLGGVEDGVAGNRSSIQTIDGEITDIYNDLTNVVRKVGEAGQVVANGLDLRGNNSVPDTVIGQGDSKPVNGKRVINELSAYEPMVRTTGNQTITGTKKMTDLHLIGYPSLIELGQSFIGRHVEARQTIMNLVQPNDDPDTTTNFIGRQFIYKGANNDETSMIFQLRSEINGEVKTGSFGITLSANGRMIIYVTDGDGTTRVLHG